MDNRIKPCWVILEPCTPKVQQGLSAELRNAIAEKNMLTTRTRKKILSELDEINNKSKESDRKRFRSQAVSEILTSEVSYLNQLNILKNYFMRPLKELGTLTINEYQTLFGNISTIYNVNSELLYELNKDPDNIAEAFSKLAPFFKLYSVYAYDYKKSLNILQNAPIRNSAFSKFLESQESRPEVQKKLSALLIAPIQRVPRYCLLLKQVLDHTNPSDPSYSLLIESLKKVELAAKHINNLVEDQENAQRLLELQRSLHNSYPSIIKPDRRLIKEGILMKMSQTGNKSCKRYVVLMNDIMMYCKLKKDNPHFANSLKCACILPLNKCTITGMLSKGAFKITCQEEIVILHHQHANEIKEWMEVIKETIEKYVNNRRTLRKDSSSRRPAHRKLLSEYQDPGISPGVPRKKKHLEEYKDYEDVFRATQHDSAESDSDNTSCLPIKTSKRKSVRDSEVKLSPPSKFPKYLNHRTQDSLYPLRRQLLRPEAMEDSVDGESVTTEPIYENVQRDNINLHREVFVFGGNYNQPQGFRFRMNNLLTGLGNSFKRLFGFGDNT